MKKKEKEKKKEKDNAYKLKKAIAIGLNIWRPKYLSSLQNLIGTALRIPFCHSHEY